MGNCMGRTEISGGGNKPQKLPIHTGLKPLEVISAEPSTNAAGYSVPIPKVQPEGDSVPEVHYLWVYRRDPIKGMRVMLLTHPDSGPDLQVPGKLYLFENVLRQITENPPENW